MTAILNQLTDLHQTVHLVRAAQSGDRDAFGRLFERFQPIVLSIAARRLNSYTEAQELCQDVFVQVLEKLHQLRTPECFVGWLRQITVRMSINRIVRRGQTVAVEPKWLQTSVFIDQSPLADALAMEQRDRVRDGLARLRKLDRQTLIAFYVRGQSLIEMADKFDAPVGTIKRRLHVARKRLAKEVAERATA